jgi:hypothetical protein
MFTGHVAVLTAAAVLAACAGSTREPPWVAYATSSADAPQEPAVRSVFVGTYELPWQSCVEAADVNMPLCGGGTIAKVSHAFMRDVAIHGSGKLCNGRVVGVQRRAPLCFATLPDSFRWGTTTSGRPAVPFRSLAVNPELVAVVRWDYIPELDGVTLPTPAVGKVHDGCVRADHVHTLLKGRVADLFTGVPTGALEKTLQQSSVHLVDADARCADVAPFAHE